MRRTRGFTLVEIMIVVAIIGILIAIAVPGFLKARETSRRNACQENLSKIDGAVQQYLLDNRVGTSEDFFTNWGTEIADWGPALIGEGSYIRFNPVCPSSGQYAAFSFFDRDDEWIVICQFDPDGDSIWNHPFPGADTTPVVP